MPRLLDALTDRPVTLLAGARQSGKSTLALVVGGGAHPARYLTFDDPPTLAAAAGDPVGFLAGLSEDVVLDEVQLVPELFRALEAVVDRDRRPGHFLLTGSAQVLLLPRLSESLAGRMEILTLWPLAQREVPGDDDSFVARRFAGEPIGDSRGSVLDSSCRPPRTCQAIVLGGFPEVRTLRDAISADGRLLPRRAARSSSATCTPPGASSAWKSERRPRPVRRTSAGCAFVEELAGERFVRGVVLHLGDAALPFGDRLEAAPVASLWLGPSGLPMGS